MRRLIDRTHAVKENHHFVRVSVWEKEDIDWWYRLISQWNGRSIFLTPKWEIGPDFSVTSDAAGSVGFGAYVGREWFAEKWPPGVEIIDISTKEMIPIVIAADIWGKCWERRRILFRTDNQAVLSTLKSGLCRDRHLAFCLRELAIRAVLGNFTFSAVFVPGKVNKAADSLSRFRFKEFRSLVPHADSAGAKIPHLLLHKLLFPPWTANGCN